MKVNDKFSIAYFDQKTQREVSAEVRILQIRVNGYKQRWLTGEEKVVTLNYCIQEQPTVAFYGVRLAQFNSMRSRFEFLKEEHGHNK